VPKQSKKQAPVALKVRKRRAPSAKPAKEVALAPLDKLLFKPYFKRIHLAPRIGPGATPWSVPDLCKAYNWPTGLAGGGVIAIVQPSGGWVQSDMDSYFKSIGQPVPQITDISVDGTQNTPNQHLNNPDSDPDHEVALDIQVAGASYFVATGKPAVIRVYWSQSLGGAISAAANAGCDVCSISWGADESVLGSDLVQQIEDAASDAAGMGMVIFAASGDNDSSDGGPTPTNVDAPASCPHVIGCGGTNKTAAGETVWNDDPGNPNGRGTGGGYSHIFPIQSWQASAPNGPGRMVPDVAANAGCVSFVHGQQLIGTGGTSAVAPIYAGLFAGFGKKLGWVTPKLWANQLCFNDIREGNNGFYRALSGPDPCIGLGSPIGTKLAVLLAR
jgi:kumamolisin